jgi:plasmid stability protein
MAELNLKNFPDALHQRLKVQAAQEGVALRELVIGLLEKGTTVLIVSKRKK